MRRQRMRSPPSPQWLPWCPILSSTKAMTRGPAAEAINAKIMVCSSLDGSSSQPGSTGPRPNLAPTPGQAVW